MRPVEKPQIGHSIQFRNSNDQVVNHVVQVSYKPYSEAKMPLVACIGEYCSYCELKKDIGDLAVEHITAKTRGGALTEWDNFLLSCNVCNSNKGAQLINITDSHWPHLNNTYMSFIYDASGRVNINPILTGLSRQHAQKLYDTCKLGRYPQSQQSPSLSDFRWRKRLETWNRAMSNLQNYINGKLTIDDVLENALLMGNWSIWFTVFKGEDLVRRELIFRFPGTATMCFDSANHYEPIPRNPQNAVDPV